MKDPSIKGFRVETCSGGSNCPNRAVETESLAARIIEQFEVENLADFLRVHVGGPSKYHHVIRASISDCPNACSQPQIKDIGIIGAVRPAVLDVACDVCGACSQKCKEQAIIVDARLKKPLIDYNLCVKCGHCVAVCPTHTLAEGEKGFRILLGGKLGRHPKLATELPGLFSEDETVCIIGACIRFYKKHAKNGERFGSLIARYGLDEIINGASP
jgi:dissimilatory sulfite reductase (desulfoviridin) alpha/beta subunit